jgi:hypothetical protein
MGLYSAYNLRRIGKQIHLPQMIKYRNRDKGVSIKLGNPMTESHGLDNDRKYIPISHLEGELLFGFGKILYQPIAPKIPNS